MLSQRLANIAFMVLVLGLCAYLAVLAQGFQAAGLLASSGLPSSFFPHLTLGFMAVCAVGVLVTYVSKGKADDKEAENVYDEPAEARRGLLTLVAVIIGYFIWQIFGYIPMAVFLAAATGLAMGVRSPIIYVSVYLIFGCVYVIFTQVLGTQF